MTTDETTARDDDDDEEGAMMSSSSTYSPLLGGNTNSNNDTSLFGGDHAETNNNKKKATRINWSKSPHRERLIQIINDWYTQSGMAIDSITNEPITDYKVYANKVGIPKTTLFRYIHKDPSKRRFLVMNTDTDNTVINNNNDDNGVLVNMSNHQDGEGMEGGVEQSNETGGGQQHVQLLLLGAGKSNDNNGQRGKKRLIDDMGIKFIVGQLKAKTNV